MNWIDLDHNEPLLGGYLEFKEEGGPIKSGGYRIVRGRISAAEWVSGFPRFTLTEVVEFEPSLGEWCRSQSLEASLILDLSEIGEMNALFNPYRVGDQRYYFNTLVGMSGVILPATARLPDRPIDPPIQISDLIALVAG